MRTDMKPTKNYHSHWQSYHTHWKARLSGDSRRTLKTAHAVSDENGARHDEVYEITDVYLFLICIYFKCVKNNNKDITQGSVDSWL